MGRSVAISGASGAIGAKLMCFFAEYSSTPRIVGLDVREPTPELRRQIEAAATRNSQNKPLVEWTLADLANPSDDGWIAVLNEVNAFIHLAFQNPLSSCSWEDVRASLDMVNNTALEAVRSQSLDRYLFASSNHVMGGYKEPFETGRLAPGELTTNKPYRVGTLLQKGRVQLDFTPYASCKFAGERLLQALASRENGRTAFCSVRIGWSMPGEDFPAAPRGMYTISPDSPEPEIEKQELSEIWTHYMWISNRDLGQLFHKAIEVDARHWPNGYVAVNGMSNNRGMPWSLEEGRQWIGYEPRDDFFEHLERFDQHSRS